MKPCLIYITTSGANEAESIARTLLEKRLIACANILPAATSFYYWEGRLEKADEAVLIGKTTSSLVNDLTEAVLDLHSAECPCIVSVPIEAGHRDFLDWIAEETGQPVLHE